MKNRQFSGTSSRKSLMNVLFALDRIKIKSFLMGFVIQIRCVVTTGNKSALTRKKITYNYANARIIITSRGTRWSCLRKLRRSQFLRICIRRRYNFRVFLLETSLSKSVRKKRVAKRNVEFSMMGITL